MMRLTMPLLPHLGVDSASTHLTVPFLLSWRRSGFSVPSRVWEAAGVEGGIQAV